MLLYPYIPGRTGITRYAPAIPTRTLFITMQTRRANPMPLLRSALIAGLYLALAGIPASAQENRSGAYAGLAVGVANSSVIESTNSGITHPTRCDRHLYPASVSPPSGDPACLDNTPAILSSNKFEPGIGMIGGFMIGYRTGGLRFEAEYLHRYMGDDTQPIGGTTSASLLDKNSEWSTDHPPHEWIGDFRAHQFFANVYYEESFLNDSRWTPYVGGGAGLAVTKLSYYAQFTRKPDAEYLQIAFTPDWPDVAKSAAAGTASILDTAISGHRVRVPGIGWRGLCAERTHFRWRHVPLGPDWRRNRPCNLGNHSQPCACGGRRGYAIRLRHGICERRLPGPDGQPEVLVLRKSNAEVRERLLPVSATLIRNACARTLTT